MTHEEAERLVIRTAQLTAALGGEGDEVQKELRDGGIPGIEAKKAYHFVQAAFGWALVQKLGVTRFPSELKFQSSKGSFAVPVSSQHLFTTALAVGVGILKHGYTDALPKEVFSSVATSSAEVNAANKALNESVDISGAEISTTFYDFEPEDFGITIRPWWKLWRT